MGLASRGFGADAHHCIMVQVRTGPTEYKGVARMSAPDGELPSDDLGHRKACGYVDDRLRRPSPLPPLPEQARKAGKCSPSPTYPKAPQQTREIEINGNIRRGSAGGPKRSASNHLTPKAPYKPAPAKAGERAMRRRQLKWLWARLKQLSMMALSREELLMKLGAARAHAPAAWRLVVIAVAPECVTFTYHLDRNRLRRARQREGRYLLRTNLTEDDAAKLWNLYLLLVRVEEAFKNLNGDLAIRPIFHQDQARIEAHIFIAFLAYCMHATLARRLHALAPGLSPRSVIEKFAAMQMIDVHVPATDRRELRLTRYTDTDTEPRF